MDEIRVSVRELVEFVLRSGDLDNRTGGGFAEAMQAGAGAHRKLQSAAGGDYRAEVPLSLTWRYGGQREGDAGGTRPGDCRESGAAQPALRVEGRADGIYRDEMWVVDEIKSTYRRLRSIRRPDPVHLAQAKCYAYMYAVQKELTQVGVRMTYCSLVTEELRYFHESYPFEELQGWFEDLMERYRPWVLFRAEWAHIRTQSIRSLSFPYSYRPGQKDLAAAVYRTIVHRRKLFLEAPTGTGKTIATLFPAIKALGEGKAGTIFYLTARTTTRTAAEQTLETLRNQRFPASCREKAEDPPAPETGETDADPLFQESPAVCGRGEMPQPASEGLRLKSVTLTAREKICVLEKPDCNPDSCPRAKGHYDRINGAIYELLTGEDGFTRDKIEACAARHQVCPFELGLDMSLQSDLVIGDYNYLFDPRACLRRFFGEEGTRRGEYIFLIDEAHNLVERGREMYSASLTREEVLSLRRGVKDLWPKLYRALGRCSRELLSIRRMMEEKEETVAAEETLPRGGSCPGEKRENASGGRPAGGGGDDVRQKGGPARNRMILRDIDGLTGAATEVDAQIGQILLEERIALQSGSAASDPLRDEKRGVQEELLEFYFNIEHFLAMQAGADDHYILYAQTEPAGRSGRAGSGPGRGPSRVAAAKKPIQVKLYCADPGRCLKECMDRGRASILFSATLLPITYYKALLGGTKEDYEIYAQSVFDPDRLGLFLVRDLTSRYRDRTADNYARIAQCIDRVIRQRHGNYMVFFPSYAFMEEVAQRLAAGSAAGVWRCGPDALECAGENDIALLRQRSGMSEAEREAFLNRFSRIYDDRSLAGFCVMGGIFGEGIDLRNDALIGVIIVGTGIPGISAERELLKEYFDERDGNGYDYAYRYPGMNHVLQAAGRVIRTREDVGIVVLMDERFAAPASRRLFPREWRDVRLTDSREIAGRIGRFWDEWL